MTIFTQIEATENCTFGRIWKPKPPRRQKNEKNTPLKAGKKNKKSGQKRYPLKADFAVLLFFRLRNTDPHHRRTPADGRATRPQNTHVPDHHPKIIRYKSKKGGGNFPLKAGKRKS